MSKFKTYEFDISDNMNMRTLAFAVEEDIQSKDIYYTLRKLNSVDKDEGKKIVKTFSCISEAERQNIVLVTLINKKAILSEGILGENGFVPGNIDASINFSNIFNTDGVTYKEFTYNPNMKRRFTIIDTVNLEEVTPIVYIDNTTNELKGKCKLLPLRQYIALEVTKSNVKMLGIMTDGKSLQYTDGAILNMSQNEKNIYGKDNIKDEDDIKQNFTKSDIDDLLL